MARTIKTDVLNPEILSEVVRGVFSQKTAFLGSQLASLGVCTVSGTMPERGPDAIGTTIRVPYFGTIGEFEDNLTDGDPATPRKIQQTSETATVKRHALAFEVSRWASAQQGVDPNVGDPYEECALQIRDAAVRKMDKEIISAAGAAGVYVKSVYSATTPVYLSHDLVVEASADAWGDESDGAVAFLTHSHGKKDLRKLKDSTGRPLLLESQKEGDFDRFAGLPVIQSDRVPLTSSGMGAVTSSGTTPPVLTLAGTPLGAWDLKIACQASHASDTTMKFSTDGGNTWSEAVAVADDGVPVAMIDPAVDSLVGVNGATGLTMAFASGTFNADNTWASKASLKVMSMILKPRALAFWYNQRALELATDKDIMRDTNLAAMHLYAAAHRYRRLAGATRPGIVQITHNVTGYA
jgi:hypothetical protein